MNWQIGTVTLPGDLEWSDELTWSPRRQAETTSLAGSTIIQRSTQVSGRPITLVTPQGVWVTRQQILDLLTYAETVDAFTVTHPDGREIVARFRYDGNDSPVDAAPIQFRSPPIATDPYTLTLRLMTA
ncbi:MAG: hypothetical protein ACOC0Q_09975 [Wenzhouxiangella sp.]